MKNLIQKGDVINYTVPSGGVTSGDLVAIGGLVGVAVNTGVEDDVVAVHLCGVYEVPKTSGAITKGARLYYKADTENLTTSAAGNTFAGFAWQAQESGDATCLVLLSRGDDAGASLQVADVVAALTGTLTGTVNGALVDVAATAAATAGGAMPSAAQVDAGIATAVASIVTGVNEQNKEMLTKINEIIAELKEAGLMATS